MDERRILRLRTRTVADYEAESLARNMLLPRPHPQSVCDRLGDDPSSVDSSITTHSGDP